MEQMPTNNAEEIKNIEKKVETVKKVEPVAESSPAPEVEKTSDVENKKKIETTREGLLRVFEAAEAGVPSKEEVMGIMNGYIEGAEILGQRELSDDQGVYFMEIRTKDQNPANAGGVVEYTYVRKGMRQGESSSAAGTILKTFYDSDEVPFNGDPLFDFLPIK